MSKLTHRITRKEFHTANRIYNGLFNGNYYSFMGFIGLTDFAYDAGFILCSELALRKIEMLNSPHAYALMKAFIARTGYHKKLVERNYDRNPV